ncbi:M4 family metallopeptidase [Xenorhabdus innexi]|uniref:Neutral metalloproteinase n=1 Tax=Xenorhabdus innexi TaxID=290109 RepID=A0A1N6MVS0_9GAMM|nr:M4 family metallopeptidase [Xenorhabdus innexi]PHM38297.1 zinc metalloproteinase aureolysin [Xenorhabdus innexi]SIP72839.1 Protease prtS [Xenorhabdus innexi]
MKKQEISRCCLIPPFVLEQISNHCDEYTNQHVLKTLDHVYSLMKITDLENASQTEYETESDETIKPNRTIYDAEQKEEFPGGKLVRNEGMPDSDDIAVNEAYEYLGKTHEFYNKIFGRNSLDNRGLKLVATVHYGKNYLNAFWSRKQMVFGDGDGQYFNRFTSAIDVIAHELTHGVIQNEVNLYYAYQSGALNESISDAFGIMVKQYANHQRADESDWLLGKEILGPHFNPENKSDIALRSFIKPGTAFSNDRQVAHMDQYEELPITLDNGGVHIYSGIPNKAFYLLAIALGGYSWERAGKIWYETLLDDDLSSYATFDEFATLTIKSAERLFGKNIAHITSQCWKEVGVLLPKNDSKNINIIS